jgi:transposase
VAPPRCSVPLLEDSTGLRSAYESADSIADLASRLGVSASTVRRALVRHGIDRLPRNRNRRPTTAAVLDDPAWLVEQYRTRTAVAIASDLGVSSRTVYAAMQRHRIERRSEPGTLALTQPRLTDGEWLTDAVERASSTTIAAELGVNAGTVCGAYRRIGIEPSQTTQHYVRGRSRVRPTADELRTAWHSEETFQGVARQLGMARTTASVWLAEIGVFASDSPKLSRTELVAAIEQQQSLTDIAAKFAVAVTTVRVELHRHRLFENHRHRHRR